MSLNWEKNNRQVKARGREDTSSEWWWVPARGGSRCAMCSEPAAGQAAYQHATQEVLCPLCVDKIGVIPKVSRRTMIQGKKKSKI